MIKTFKSAGPVSGDTVLTLGQKWLNVAHEVGSGGPSNLVPNNSTYNNATAQFTVTVVVGGVYEWIKGANDLSATNGSVTYGSDATFLATSTTLTLTGVAGTGVTVTAQVFKVG